MWCPICYVCTAWTWMWTVRTALWPSTPRVCSWPMWPTWIHCPVRRASRSCFPARSCTVWVKRSFPRWAAARLADVRLTSIWRRCASWAPRWTRNTRTASTSPRPTACTARRSTCPTRRWAPPSRLYWRPCWPRARPNCRARPLSRRSWIWCACCRRWVQSFLWTLIAPSASRVSRNCRGTRTRR